MEDIKSNYQILSTVLLGWAPDDWASLLLSAPIYSDNCGGMALEATKLGGELEQLPFDWEGVDALVTCCLEIRDQHLRTTGKRIWGLTFTLYPDGKYDIAYDYNKPEDYDDSGEAGNAVGDSPVADLLGGLVNAQTALATESFLQQALKSLQDQTARNTEAWGLGTEAQWNLDMNAGSLSFTFADGRKLCAAVQVVGTYNTANGTFLWGWDHPSVPEPLRRAARLVHDYGQAHDIEAFTSRTTSCTEAEAWSFTAAAAQLDGSSGAYRGDAVGTWVYMVFELPVDAFAT